MLSCLIPAGWAAKPTTIRLCETSLAQRDSVFSTPLWFLDLGFAVSALGS